MRRSLLKLALAAAALLATFAPSFSVCFAQGSLTPPGPPAPTMKSLDQIEPRAIVNAVNTPGDAGDMFIISQPGSYYLTTNLVASGGMNGITIEANNVTLDLGGFSLQGVSSGQYSAIFLPNAQTNITVRNGRISGWGGPGVFSYNLNNAAVNSGNFVFEGLDVSSSSDGFVIFGPAEIRGCNAFDNLYTGIVCNEFAGAGSLVSGCTCNKNGTYGIYEASGKILDCTANENGYIGIEFMSGTVSGCIAYYNTADGIYGQGTALGCTANFNGGYGVDTYDSTVSGCVACYNTDSGVYATGSVVSGCTTSGNGNNGVEADTSSTNVSPGTITGCMVQQNFNNGIFVNGSGGVIADNNCAYNNTSANTGCAGICIYGSSANNRVENNHVAGTGYAGMNVSGGNNVIIKNSVSGNGAHNYIISGTQVIGPVITATGTISNSSPWANFSY